ALGSERPFSIDPPLESLRSTLMAAPVAPPAGTPPPRRELTLEDCLDVAAQNNRDLQRRGETVFVTALSLTLARYQFEKQWFGLVSATGERDHEGTQSLRANGQTGFTQTLATGLGIMAAIGNEFLRIITHPSQRTDTSFLSFMLTQPLL